MKPEASAKRARLRGGTPRKGAPDGKAGKKSRNKVTA